MLFVDGGNDRVGIGTSSPSVTLHVKSANPVFGLETTGTVASGGTVYSELRDSSGTVFTSGFAGLANCYQFSTSAAAGFMRFMTGAGAEAMRIDSSGNLLVATTTAEATGVTIASPENGGSFLTAGITGARNHIRFKNPNGVVGSIQTSASATTYATSSDYRLKENVVTDWDATTRLKQLKPSRFNFIADADTTVDGFIAHEVQEIVPEAITGTKDAVDADGNAVMQGIDQSKLVPLLVKTIQELEARITALEGA
jgi:hypothetical protein